MSNELDRIRELAKRIHERHSLLVKCDEDINSLSDGEEKNKLIQEFDSDFHRKMQNQDLEEINKLSREVVKEIEYLKLPQVP